MCNIPKFVNLNPVTALQSLHPGVRTTLFQRHSKIIIIRKNPREANKYMVVW